MPVEYKLYEGVTYRRIVRFFPRFMIVHLLEIDTKTRGLQFFVTQPDHPDADAPLAARTTSQFLEETGAQIAVNGDGFFPWWSNSPADYYPHVGDPITPNGYTASYGKIYARLPEDADPVLLGAAMLGASAAGAYPDLKGAMEGMASEAKLFEPAEGDTAALHHRRYAAFTRMQDAARKARGDMTDF